MNRSPAPRPRTAGGTQDLHTFTELAFGRPFSSRERILNAQIADNQWQIEAKQRTLSVIDEEIDGVDKRIDRLRAELVRIQSPPRRRFFGSTERPPDIVTPAATSQPKPPRARSLDPRVRWRFADAQIDAKSPTFGLPTRLTHRQRIAAIAVCRREMDASLSRLSAKLNNHMGPWSEKRQGRLLDYVEEIAMAEEWRGLLADRGLAKRRRQIVTHGLKAAEHAIGTLEESRGPAALQVAREHHDRAEAAHYVATTMPHHEYELRARGLYRTLRRDHHREHPRARGIGVPIQLIADLVSLIGRVEVTQRTIEGSYLGHAPASRSRRKFTEQELEASRRFQPKLAKLRTVLRNAESDDDGSRFRRFCEEYYQTLFPSRLS